MKTILLLPCLFAIALAYPRLPTSHNRIVGGVEAEIEEAPYLLSYRILNRHLCGASLISNKVALTAAHCTDGIFVPTWMTVVAGATYINNGGVSVKINGYTQHKNFDAYTLDYDIAMLYLAEDVLALSPVAKTIGLQSFTLEPATVVTAFGWGQLYKNGPSPDKLQKVSLATISHDTCKNALSNYLVSEVMMCTYTLNKDACQGDSGGPLVDQYNNKLVGIISWGEGCAKANTPGVFTNIAKMNTWIYELLALAEED